MAAPRPRLTLLTPPVADDALVEALAAACAAGDVAAVILRLAASDTRSLTDLVKRYAPAVQVHEAALVIAGLGPDAEAVTVATRGGADGVHAAAGEADIRAFRSLRAGLPAGRILGAGGLPTRDAAMEAGEAGADYLLFGEALDGRAPSAEEVAERAGWWAEIFETPCIAVAHALDAVGPLARTGAEFVGLEAEVWRGAGAVAAAQAALDAAGTAR
jgi:thiamine-phosphate pyrophosphorylase